MAWPKELYRKKIDLVRFLYEYFILTNLLHVTTLDRKHSQSTNLCQICSEKVYIYLGFYIAFTTVQVISRRIVLWAEETSTYSWSTFCAVNCRPSSKQLATFPHRIRVWTTNLRGGRQVCYHFATVAPSWICRMWFKSSPKESFRKICLFFLE